MKKSLFIVFLLGLSLTWSCGQGNKEVSASLDAKTAEMANNESTALQSESAPQENKTEPEKTALEKKIIRTGNISVESKDLKKSKANFDVLVKKAGGYYEQESSSSGSTYTNYNLTIRIPSLQFDSFLEGIEKENDKITEKSIQAQDVSLQYYDLESRLKSKRTYLDRYQKMVANAKNVKELLEIEEQIRLLQEEIESTESTLRAVKDQVSYSTIQVNIYNADSIIPHSDSGFWMKVKEALDFGWKLIENIVIGLVGIWPILFLATGGIFIWRRFRNKRKTKQ